MNPRERILATLNHELPDRTPTDAWFHQEVRKRLLHEYETDDWSVVLADLGIEGWVDLQPSLAFPRFEERAVERPGGRPGRRAFWLDERTYEDGWGIRHRMGEGDWYEEWVAGPLQHAQTPADLDAYEFPSVADIREPEDYAAQVQALKQQGMFVRAGIDNPYKRAWMLRGMDNVLADYLINVEFLEALYDRLYALYTEIILRAVRAGVDMITYTGDIAMQDRIIMGPNPWRRIDKPRIAKMIQTARAVNPDVFFFIHSDGDVTDLMDDLIEVGFNVINPIQPECMDPAEVKKRWGDRITIHGGVSIQKTFPFGTPDEVRAEIEHLIRTCGYNGGLVVFPSNVIQPDTPTANIQACFHAARDFDLRSIAR